MANLSQVHVHGVTLSLLLQSAASGCDCDGLLFGQVRKRVHQEFRDDDIDMIVVEEQYAVITSFVASSHLCTFYDAAGQVQEQQLAALEAGWRDPVIGVLVSRAGSHAPAQPSMREHALCASLQAVLSRRAASSHAAAASSSGLTGNGTSCGPTTVLLAVLSQREDHHGATLSCGYRFYQQQWQGGNPGLPSLQPVELQVLSLARHASHAPPGAAAATQLLSDTAIMMDAAARGMAATHTHQQHEQQQPLPQQQQQDEGAQVLAATAAAAMQQVAQVEEYQASLLRKLQALCRQLSDQSTGLAGLREEVASLTHQLHALDMPAP